MLYEKDFGRGEAGIMVSNSASSTGPASEVNHVARWFSHKGTRDICAVDGCFAIMPSSSFAFFALRLVPHTGS
jgi:hypothetical protein